MNFLEMSLMRAISQQYETAVRRIAADLEQAAETFNSGDLAFLEQVVPESKEFAALEFDIKIDGGKEKKKDCETQAGLSFA